MNTSKRLSPLLAVALLIAVPVLVATVNNPHHVVGATDGGLQKPWVLVAQAKSRRRAV